MTTLKHTTKKVLSNGLDHLEVLKQDAQDIGSEIRNKAVDATKAVREQAIHANDNIVELIKDNPYKSVITAFLAGLLIAKLM